jgi:hypothetical protein
MERRLCMCVPSTATPLLPLKVAEVSMLWEEVSMRCVP